MGLVVCGQVISEGTKAIVHGKEVLSQRKEGCACIQTNSTQDLFEFSCPLLEVITELN